MEFFLIGYFKSHVIQFSVQNVLILIKNVFNGKKMCVVAFYVHSAILLFDLIVTF